MSSLHPTAAAHLAEALLAELTATPQGLQAPRSSKLGRVSRALLELR